MSSVISESSLEKKFLSVTNTQDNIQTLSLWLLHHKTHHQKIVETWMKVLKKDKASHRLTLFYLANDVVQNCKRKNVSCFKDSFALVLKDATALMRDDQIKPSVERVLRIWEERNIYDSSFISELQEILSSSKQPVSVSEEILTNFKYEKLIAKIQAVKKLELEIMTKTSSINLNKLNATNAEMIQKLKDRIHGQQFTREFDDSTRCLDELIKCTEKEKEERNQLISLLEQAEIYYDSQRGDSKSVAMAYKNFGARVKLLQKKLNDVIQNLPSPVPSPVPSPCPDAPSPTNSDVGAELSLPGEEKLNEEKLKIDMKDSKSTVGESSTATIGKPIPTVSNVFGQEPGNMTSWLGTFSKKTDSPTSINTSSSDQNSSLDSRLSSLLQNMRGGPNLHDLTCGLPLFGPGLTETSNSLPNSPTPPSKANSSSFLQAGHNSLQPVEAEAKDEYSGQNTPLQDEDTPATNSTFFSRLAATPKSSQSPKEILQGLKNFIQNASTISSDKSQNLLQENNLSWSSDMMEQTSIPGLGMDTGSYSTTTSSFDNLQQHSASSAISTSSSHITHPPNTFADSKVVTSISPKINQNLSFIPTLVPSTPTATSFNFCTESTYIPYSPTHENFSTDMDIDSGDESSEIVTEQPSPPESVEKDEPRQSALITLVTDNNINNNKTLTKSDINFSKSESFLESNSLPFKESSQAPLSSNEPAYVGRNTAWPSAKPVPPFENMLNTEGSTIAASEDSNSLNESYFLSSPPLSNDGSFPNGQKAVDRDDSLSRIETVQSHRLIEEDEGWNRNRWEKQYDRPPKDFRGGQHRAPRPQGFFEQRNQPENSRPRFSPQNPHWQSPPYRSQVPNNYQEGSRRFRPSFHQRGNGGWNNRHPRPPHY